MLQGIAAGPSAKPTRPSRRKSNNHHSRLPLFLAIARDPGIAPPANPRASTRNSPPRYAAMANPYSLVVPVSRSCGTENYPILNSFSTDDMFTYSSISFYRRAAIGRTPWPSYSICCRSSSVTSTRFIADFKNRGIQNSPDIAAGVVPDIVKSGVEVNAMYHEPVMRFQGLDKNLPAENPPSAGRLPARAAVFSPREFQESGKNSADATQTEDQPQTTNESGSDRS